MPAPLFNRGFASLLATQFFGAANDNVLKQLLIFMVITGGVWAGDLGDGGQGIVGFCFTIPFILLSGYGGQLADRISKRTISIVVKFVEIPIALMAGWGFATGQLWLALGALVALAAQSAFFGPAKYGMIPELVEHEQLSRANGLINMLTNIAVILGSWLGGVVADTYYPAGATAIASAWLPFVWFIGIAVAGLLSILTMTPLPAIDRGLPLTINPIGPYMSALRDMAKTPLLFVALAWGYFYLLAGIALLIVPEYANVLNIDRETAARILAILAVAIGVGSITAGLVSGRRINMRLVPIGAIGVSVSFILLGLVPPTFTNVCLFIGAGGFFAGFYLLPLQASLQAYSPPDERGRFLGTANAISFAFLALAALIFALIRPWFAQPQQLFLPTAAMMILGTVAFLIPVQVRIARHERDNGTG